jgi:hypothetical protein
MYQERTYRNLINSPELTPYRVVVKETDLMVYSATKLINETKELVLEQRGYVEAFIKSYQILPEHSFPGSLIFRPRALSRIW